MSEPIYYCRRCGKRRSRVGDGWLICSKCGAVGLSPCTQVPAIVTCPVKKCRWRGWADGVNDQLPDHLKHNHREEWMRQNATERQRQVLTQLATFAAEGRIATPAAIADVLGVSRPTVRHALRDLENLDLAVRVERRGRACPDRWVAV